MSEQAYEALQAGLDFIQTVERWKGSDPDEADELIALIEAALAAREEPQGEHPDADELRGLRLTLAGWLPDEPWVERVYELLTPPDEVDASEVEDGR